MAGAGDTFDLDQFAAWAERAAARVQGADPAPAFERIKLLLVGAAKENFQNSRGPDGTAWPPLRFARARSKDGGASDKPLRDTGALMASLTADGPGHVERSSREEFVWGTNLAYAAVHQDGYPNILPVQGKALAVPLTPEAHRAGAPRQFPRPLVVYWKKGATTGALVEWLGKGKTRRQVRQFLLLPKSSIPARPFLGMNAALAAGCERILGDWFAQEVGG